MKISQYILFEAFHGRDGTLCKQKKKSIDVVASKYQVYKK